MATLGGLRDRILDELAESSLTSQVELAIRSAVDAYQRETFYFTESFSLTATTSAGAEYYSAADFSFISGLPHIDSIVLLNGTTRVPLTKRSKLYMDDIATETTSQGEPGEFSYYAQRLRLYPIPDGEYTLIVSSDPRQATLSASTDTNVWTTEAEELIRYRAKADVEINVERNPEAKAEAMALASGGYPYLSLQEKIAHQALVRETVLRSSADIQPNEF